MLSHTYMLVSLHVGNLHICTTDVIEHAVTQNEIVIYLYVVLGTPMYVASQIDSSVHV